MALNTPSSAFFETHLPQHWQAEGKVILLAFLQPHSSSEQYVNHHLVTVSERYGDRVLVQQIDTSSRPEFLIALVVALAVCN